MRTGTSPVAQRAGSDGGRHSRPPERGSLAQSQFGTPRTMLLSMLSNNLPCGVPFYRNVAIFVASSGQL